MRAGPRLVGATAHTTLDFVEAAARGADWTDDGTAVVNVERPRAAPGTVRLDVELDGTALEGVAPHADRLRLTPEQARTLGTALVDAADAEPTAGGR